MKKTLSILLSILLVFGTTAFALTANAEGEPAIVDQGYCGVGDNRESVWYTLDSDGQLTIGGTGVLGSGSWSGYFAPYTYSVNKVVIEDGITGIGGKVFQGSSLAQITVPASVTSIGYRAFYEANALHVFAYQGTPEQWAAITFGEECGTYITSAYNTYLNGHEIVSLRLERTSAAACSQTGMEEYNPVCNQCGELTAFASFRKTLPVDPDNHVHTTSFPATEATETEHGYTAGVYCNDCETWISGHEAIHTPGETVIENNVPATCTEAGGYDEVVYCTVCPAEISRNHVTVPAPGHAWGEWEVVKQATVDETGLMRRVCQNNAEHVEEQIIPKLKPNTTVFQQFIEWVQDFFEGIADWFSRLFRW